eukprot:m.54929 g.54929  ORF g.54929 m.54929 type:complete len:335 (-) comp12909_c1_seq1:521-1525(-)
MEGCSSSSAGRTATVASAVVLALILSSAAGDQWSIPHHNIVPPRLQRCTCRELLTNFTRPRGSIAPVKMTLSPEEQLAFSHDNLVPLGTYVVDDTNQGEGWHYKFSHKSISDMIDTAGELLSGKRSPAPLTGIQRWFLEAISKHFNNKKMAEGERLAAVVWGSTSPWYEAVMAAAGAATVTTIEYNKLTYDHPQLETLQPHDLQGNHRQFDVAVSTSSFDHDGLGRYGDPLDPFGDIKAMKLARCLLKPGGLMFFAVPVGPDITVYNLHRRYGPLRLPSILDQWEIIDIVGWDAERLTLPADYRKSYEPIFVLRKPDSKNRNSKQVTVTDRSEL